MLMCEPVNMVVDHIDADTTNNRRNNLRVITNAQNIQNKKGARRDSNTGIRGVNWHKPSNKWVARFQVDGKRINLGTFDDINEAEKAVKEARAKYMPFSKEALQ
jgi:GTP:adenosylcobinamide-phosphate guanylyltransferase